MALVLALLLMTLCGVHAASIPSNSLDTMLASKSDKLEKWDTPNLDKIRRSVLEDMKRLLDTQLAALFENAVTQKADAQRKRLISNTKTHATSKKGDTTDLDSIIPEEPQNSELIKILTDDSLQDPGDELLRNAVDQLLKEDEDGTADLNNGEVYNNEDQLNDDNSTKSNSEEFIGEDAFDEATLPPINTNGKDRQKGKSNKKGISHVIIEHVPKTNKNNNADENPDDIIDLDKILKSTLNDVNGSISQEDENSRDEESEGGDPEANNFHPKSSEKKQPGIFNDSQTGLKIHDVENNSFQVDGINNVHIDENTLKPDTPDNNLQNDDNNGELEINSNYTNDVHFKTNQYKHVHRHRKNDKGRQPINYNVNDENHTNKRHDINRAGKTVNQDENDTKDLQLEEIEIEKDHNERQRPHKKSKNRYSKNHPYKNHHSKRRSKNQDKNKHRNDNKTHYHGTTGHHIIVRLISDSDGSNESKLDTIHDRPIHKKNIHNVSSYLRKGDQDNKKSIYSRNSYDSSKSRENTINEVNASQVDGEDKNDLTEIKDSNSNEEENDITKRGNISYENEPGSKEDDLIERNDVTKEESSNIDEELLTREGNKKTSDTKKDKKERNRDYEDAILVGKEETAEKNENVVTNDMGEVSSEKYKASKEIDDTDAKTRISDVDENARENEEVAAEEDKKPKKGIHNCHHEQIGNEIDESNLIHDLLQNKEMKKSYSLSLTLSTK